MTPIEKIQQVLIELNDFFGDEQDGDGIVWARQCRNVKQALAELDRLKPIEISDEELEKLAKEFEERFKDFGHSHARGFKAGARAMIERMR